MKELNSYEIAETEKMFYRYLEKEPQLFDKILSDYWDNSIIKDIFLLAKSHYKEFKKFPTKNDIIYLIENSKREVDNDILDTLYSYNLNITDEAVYNRIRNWIKTKSLEHKIVLASGLIKLNNKNNIDTLISEIKILFNNSNEYFDEDLGLDFFNPEHHNMNVEAKIETMYESFNKDSGGGYDTKTLIVYLGPPNIGKSIFLANEASFHLKNNKNVILISAEMSKEKIAQRIAANLFNITMDNYFYKYKDKDYTKEKLDNLKMTTNGKLFIKQVPTSRFNVNDIEAYIKKIEEVNQLKIDVLVIDYLNILSNQRNPNSPSDKTYGKIKDVIEDLRAVAILNDILIISATQANRGAYGQDNFGMENISESASVAHTADTIFAIIQTPHMRNSEIYHLKCIKSRDSGAKDKVYLISVDYDKMKLIDKGEITIN